MSFLRSSILTSVVALIFVSQAVGQTNPSRLTFEVASIRPSQPGGRGGGIKPIPGGNGYVAQNVSVKLMIALMYKVPMRQISGGPEWLNSQLFDIEARADHAYSIDDLHTMFQNLLADRFNLKFHKESKDGPVYALLIDKSGLKMKSDPQGEDLKIPITPKGNGEVTGVRVPMQYLSWWLGQQLQFDGRPVIDKTGLQDTYDFTLKFLPPLPPDVQRDSLPPELQELPSIFDAVEQQLGLRLEPQRGPVEFYVIDHIDKPSEN